MNVLCSIVMTVEALRRSSLAVTFGFTEMTVGLMTRSRLGFVSLAATAMTSARRLMSRPRRECVTRTLRSEILSAESRAGRCRRFSIRAANFSTGPFV